MLQVNIELLHIHLGDDNEYFLGAIGEQFMFKKDSVVTIDAFDVIIKGRVSVITLIERNGYSF